MPSIINSDDGVVSGSSGLKTTGGNDGITNFQQNGTTQATITAAGLFQFNSGYGSVATAYGCRAWVNFNGTGTVAIRASGNVTSITDNGTGDYTVNFTTALPDINFSINGICSILIGNNCPMVFDNSPVRARTTSSASIRTMDTGNFGDPVWANVAVFR
jgi:hypothetical protein